MFREHYRQMYVAAYSLLYDEQESKDAVSGVFASLLENDIDLMPATARHYLLRAVRNRCFNVLRDKTNRERIANLYLPPSAEDTADDDTDDRLARLMRFVGDNLSAQELDIFNMRFVEGMSYKDICTVTGTSRIAVWKHLSHVIDLLKQHFNPTKQ